ncbi:Helix-turn-helix domain, partial [Frankia torreyi]
MEIAAGRRAPFTMLGDWVALSGIDDHAKALYWCLAMHVNVARDDTEVWPSRYTLAEWCGFAKAESVDRYLAQLVELGAIEVRQHRHAGGMRARNRYLVHGSPSDDYAGARSLHEWYQRRRAEADPEPSRSPFQRTTARPAETRETPAQPVVRSSGLPESAPADLGSPPQRTGTKTKNNKTKNTTTPARTRKAPAPKPPTGGGGSSPLRPTTEPAAESEAARLVLDTVAGTLTLGGPERAVLAAPIDAAVAAGWEPAVLAAHLTADPTTDKIKQPGG